MADNEPVFEEQLPELDKLMEMASKGAGATSAQEYLKDYLWLRIWKATIAVANCPADHATLLAARAELKATMQLAQELLKDKLSALKAKELIARKYEVPDARK